MTGHVSIGAPRISDMVHYRPEMSGCRAAIVTEIHYDPQLASLMVIHSTGIQFLPGVEHAEREHPWDEYRPGTWHLAGHL